MPEVFPELGNIFAPGAKVIHIDLNAYEIAKNHPVDMGLVSDPKLTLAKLASALEAIMTPAQKAAAKARTAEIAKAKETKRSSQLERDNGPAGCRAAAFFAFHGRIGSAITGGDASFLMKP